jgi:2-haloacid dehalogenase
MSSPHSKQNVRALLFDVFGTLVDWRGSIIQEGEQLGARHGITMDWPAFADAWRSGYQPAMSCVRQNQRSWVNLDVLHRELLDHLLMRFDIQGLIEEEVAHLNRAWHRLNPWPDVVAGLNRLKQHYIISPLSNGHVELLVNLAKHAALPWDCILSAELAKRYKPDPEVYMHAITLLGLSPQQTIMVAAHLDDLAAAKALGLHTAFICRPNEFGPEHPPEQPSLNICDFIAVDLGDLADQLIA